MNIFVTPKPYQSHFPSMPSTPRPSHEFVEITPMSTSELRKLQLPMFEFSGNLPARKPRLLPRMNSCQRTLVSSQNKVRRSASVRPWTLVSSQNKVRRSASVRPSKMSRSQSQSQSRSPQPTTYNHGPLFHRTSLLRQQPKHEKHVLRPGNW